PEYRLTRCEPSGRVVVTVHAPLIATPAPVVSSVLTTSVTIACDVLLEYWPSVHSADSPTTAALVPATYTFVIVLTSAPECPVGAAATTYSYSVTWSVDKLNALSATPLPL